jgi:hypothetical protein
MKQDEYLIWFDDDRRTEPAQKIADAVANFVDRFGFAPSVVLVNRADVATCPGVQVVAAPNVMRHDFWVGFQVPARLVPAATEAPAAGEDGPLVLEQVKPKRSREPKPAYCCFYCSSRCWGGWPSSSGSVFPSGSGSVTDGTRAMKSSTSRRSCTSSCFWSPWAAP